MVGLGVVLGVGGDSAWTRQFRGSPAASVCVWCCSLARVRCFGDSINPLVRPLHPLGCQWSTGSSCRAAAKVVDNIRVETDGEYLEK